VGGSLKAKVQEIGQAAETYHGEETEKEPKGSFFDGALACVSLRQRTGFALWGNRRHFVK